MSVARYECFCSSRAVSGASSCKERGAGTHDEREEERQDKRAKVCGGEGKTVGGEDVLGVRDGTLQNGEAAQVGESGQSGGRAEVKWEGAHPTMKRTWA